MINRVDTYDNVGDDHHKWRLFFLPFVTFIFGGGRLAHSIEKEEGGGKMRWGIEESESQRRFRYHLIEILPHLYLDLLL